MEIVKRKGVSLDINLTPLIDIVFLLLIFFLLTSSFFRYEALEISLPTAESSAARDSEALTVTVLGRDRYRVGSSEYSKDTLLQALLSKRNSKELAPIYLQIDKGAEVEILVEAMDFLRKSGFVDITLATR